MRIERVIIEADGGSRGNPGPGGYGAVVVDPESGVVLAERSGSLGTTTNNVAEYSGLIAGLRAAAELGARAVEARMDSKLVVEQVSGRWRVKHPGLRPLAAQAAGLMASFDSVRVEWIPRSRNARADALANAAMDAAATPTTGQTDDAGGQPAGKAPSPGGEVRHWTPPAGRCTRLILVRHGETPLSVQRRFSGQGDPVLTERGQAQALAVANRLRVLLGEAAAGAGVHVVSSPLSRARQTATAITAALGVGEFPTDERLAECDFGEWEGHTFGEVGDRWPQELDAWLGSTAVAPPGGESFDQVATRIWPAMAELRESYHERAVVVVGHVTGIKLVLRDALDGGSRFLHRLHLDPAGLSIVDSWPDGGVSVRTVNDTSHLGDLVT